MDEDGTNIHHANLRAAQDRFLLDSLEVERQFGFAARTAVVTAAGALTLSIGAFVRGDPPVIGDAVGLLTSSWVLLFGTVILGAVALVFRFTSRHLVHVEWERQEKQMPSRAPRWLLRAVDWGSLVTLGSAMAMLAFGMIALARVAFALLSNATNG